MQKGCGGLFVCSTRSETTRLVEGLRNSTSYGRVGLEVISAVLRGNRAFGEGQAVIKLLCLVQQACRW